MKNVIIPRHVIREHVLCSALYDLHFFNGKGKNRLEILRFKIENDDEIEKKKKSEKMQKFVLPGRWVRTPATLRLQTSEVFRETATNLRYLIIAFLIMTFRLTLRLTKKKKKTLISKNSRIDLFEIYYLRHVRLFFFLAFSKK